MKLTFTLNKKDYIDFNLYHIQYSEVTKKKLNSQRLMGSLSFVGLGVISLFTGGKSQLVFSLLIFAFGAFWYYKFPSFALKRIKKSTEKAIDKGKLKDLFNEITIEVTEDGLKEHNTHGEFDIAWKDVREVVYLSEYTYIFLEEQGAMVLPHRVIEDDELVELKAIIEKGFKGSINHLDITLS